MSTDAQICPDHVPDPAPAVAPHPAERRRQATTGAGVARHRPEIQGLRAVAVLLVVFFHLWPAQLSGGFVGVDVFFVISGYLITDHIHRETVRTGTLSLHRFWARRIRRLLPASLLVLALGAVATVTFLPATEWATTARQLAASALYVQNWALAGDAVDYMAQDNAPTLAQHYWSLSVEEQFYVLWPVLVLGIVVLSRRSWIRWSGRRLLAAGIALLGAVSLVYSVVATYADPAAAYFVTPTRIWEFAAGGLLALLALPTARRGIVRALIGGAGLAAIVAAGVFYDGATLFPGWVALLPVLGTVAVMAAGPTSRRFTPHWWLTRRPATFIGDISYSVYLWHWPLIIVLPHVTGTDLRLVDKLGIFAATLVLAWLSKVYVEDPLRTRTFLAAAPWRAFAFAGAGMALVVAGTVAVNTDLDRRESEAEARAEAVLGADAVAEPCVGPAALAPDSGCDPIGSGPLIPLPEVAVEQNRRSEYQECQQAITQPDVIRCEKGYTGPDPKRVIALVGDSHATHWLPGLELVAESSRWTIVTYLKSSCPPTSARRVLDSEQTDEAGDSCERWVREVRDEVAADPSVSIVVTSMYTTAYEFTDGRDTELDDPEVDGFAPVWDAWTEAGKDVVVIRDVPPTQGGYVPTCLSAHPGDEIDCATPAGDLPDDAAAVAAGESDDPRVHLLDLTDRFCDDDHCYPVVGGVIVYRDYSHLTREYAAALAPELGARLNRALTEEQD
ncbi:acyltransferase [Jiangella ureilytica]|uniref:Acyltransferase n=1 Tax=Jiangella ureilytica TaxID=2530374 RepID=A0A4R4RW53_9ACTN|nr:acyltransferase family protein [Jiangella ureilytica]TDC54398.1 acyltransferase [Jiangella ureilytica]